MSNPTVTLRRDQIMRLLDGNPVQVATPVGLLDVTPAEDQPWQPMLQRPMPAHIVSHHRAHGIRVPDELWSNDIYEVFVAYLDENEPDSGRHLSIKRYDRAPVRNWRHFQQMKNEICGEFCEGMELFPSEARIADNANQYHLWVMPEGEEIPIGFEGGMTLLDPTEVEQYNSHGKGRQEPLQPGLTIGQKMEDHQRESGDADHETRRAIIEGRPPS